MILSGHTIRRENIIFPHLPRTTLRLDGPYTGSFGESVAGYDIRIAQDRRVWCGEMTLASSIEYFKMPRDVLGLVKDKSTWARRGLTVQNTVIEPGWEGYLTMELTLHPLSDREASWEGLCVDLEAGWPIAQVIFQRVDCTTAGYDGKYQHQGAEPQGAL